MAKTVITLSNTEMQNLLEFVRKCSVHTFWITEEYSGIGNKLTVSTSAGKKQDITDYESW